MATTPVSAFISFQPLSLHHVRSHSPLIVTRPPFTPRTLHSSRPLLVARCTSPPSANLPDPPQTPSKPIFTRPILLLLSILPILPFLHPLLKSFPPLHSILSTLTAHAAHLGPLRASLLLAAINFCTVLLCFPANMGLMVAAGALLKPIPAFMALFISKLLAASVAFVLARSILAARASVWLQNRPRLAKVLRSSGRDGGWRFVLLMRLSPFPGFLLNYLLSLTGVSYPHYLFATILGIAPSILNLVLIGSAARDVGIGVTGSSLASTTVSLFAKAMCIASMIIVMIYVTRKTRQAFSDVDLSEESVSPVSNPPLSS